MALPQGTGKGRTTLAWVKRGTEALLILSLFLATYAFLSEGKDFTLGPLRVSLSSPRNPLIFAGFFLGLRILFARGVENLKSQASNIALFSAFLFVFILPFHNQIRPTLNILGGVLIVSGIIFFLAGGRPRLRVPKFVLYALILFLFLSFLSGLLGIDRAYGLRIFLIRDLFNAALFLTLAALCVRKETFHRLLDCILLSAACALIAGIIIFIKEGGYFTGTFSWYNTAALYLDLLVPFLIGALFAVRGTVRKWGTFSLLLLALLCLVLTRSRGGWVASAAALGGTLLYIRPRLLIPAVLAAAIGLFFLPSSFTRRIEQVFHFKDFTVSSKESPLKFRPAGWKSSLRMIQDRPILGGGPGLRTFRTLYSSYRMEEGPGEMVHAHNTPLQMAVELGLPGSLLFFILIFSVAFSGFVRMKREREYKALRWAILMGFGALLLHGAVEYSYLPKQSHLFWTFAAILFIPSCFAGSKKQTSPSKKLSFCIVTMGVQASLERCLKSLQGLGDEIIVLDGDPEGSSRSVAESFDKVRYFIHPWDGSITRQKNRAMDLALGEWIFLIDSDEVLGKSLRSALPKLVEGNRFDFYKFPRYWLVNDIPPQYAIHEKLYPDFQLRLIRNRPRMRYDSTRKVHHFFPKEERGKGKKVRGAHILHYCFIDNDRKEREERVKLYMEMEGTTIGINQIYLYEDLKFTTGQCPEEF